MLLDLNIISPIPEISLSRYLQKLNKFKINYHHDNGGGLNFAGESWFNQSGLNCYWTTIGYPLDSQRLNVLPPLDFIVTATTGLTHIDLAVAKDKEIEIVSLLNEHLFLSRITATPEHTWALVLSVWRKIFIAGSLPSFQPLTRESFMSRQLSGKSIGFIGFGRVGKQVSKYATAFGMDIYAYDKYESFSDDNEFKHVNFVQDIKEIAHNSDITVVAASVIAQDSHQYPLVNEAYVNSARPGSIIINTARGILVDEESILNGVKSGHLFGAGFDVLSTEDISSKQATKANIPVMLYKAKEQGYNVVVTPHIAGMCSDAFDLAMNFVSNKLLNKLNEKFSAKEYD
jgi:D-3-phosphoglycerate dehydrogenase